MYKALFVDDEVDFLETIEMLFSTDPDLDVSMPDVDGGELAIALRENAITNHIPIVFITAVVTNAERGVHGGQIFLPKPVKSAEIKAILKELLE